jgi:acyl carrier protein
MRAAGARVITPQVDVSDEGALLRLLRDKRGALPELRGVFHVAGLFDDTSLIELETKRLREVLAARVEGAWNLHHQTLDAKLDFFIMFSSAGSVLGSPGLGAYSASNAYLDAMAHHRRALGMPALSVNWGPWAEGDAASNDARRIMIPGGFDLLERLVGEGHPQVVVLPYDITDLLRFFPRAAGMRMFEELLAGPSPVRAVAARANRRGNITADFLAPRTDTERLIADTMRRVLNIDRVGVQDSFFELGGDSIMGGVIITRLNSLFGVTLNLADVFDAFTIERLADLVEAKLTEGLQNLGEEELQRELEKHLK